VRSPTQALVGILAVVASTTADVRAQTPARTGAASDAQPGIVRVPVAESTAPAVAISAGYGYTEKLDGAPGSSHRIGARLAGAAGVLPWLTLGAVANTRHDRHSGDSGTMLDGALIARGALPLGSLRIGAELKAWVPGAEEAGTTFGATSLDARLLFGAWLEGVLAAFTAGYRFDRSAEAGERAPRLGFGDRAALGLSEFDAVLLGLGVAVPLGPAEIVGEVSGDLLVGGGAPSVLASPLRATAGARLSLSERLSLELLVDGSLAERPKVGPAEPLVPIEPRIGGLVGLRYRFTPTRVPVARAARTPVTRPVTPKAAPAPDVPADAPFEVVLVDEEGAPVRNADVTLRVADRSEPLTGDDSGRYRNDHIPKGPAKLVIEAPGYEPFERELVVEPGKRVTLPATLKSLPPPSQVRGVVRSFGGQALVAKVRVDPLGIETTTDATGAFQVDVAPGSYDVTIEAEGYENQRRQVRVDAQGVVILNADLVRKKK
jgi:hypothetical protein